MNYLRRLSRFNNPISNYICLTVLFFLLVLVLPANQAALHDYKLSSHTYHILLFVVELPLAVVWFAGFYGYTKLRRYARVIAETNEGDGFGRLALGIGWLAWGLILPSLISLILNGFANRHPAFHTTAIVITNYLSLLFPLIAFSIINDGTRRFRKRERDRYTLIGTKLIMFLFIVLGVVYCFLTFRHVDLSHLSSSNNPYYLPVWLLISTVVVPYLYAWFIGLLAAYDIGRLAKRARGILYQQSLRLVSAGVVMVVSSLIGVQYLRSVIPRTGRLSLNSLLIAIYLIYIVLGVGFALISAGASRLKRIEDI